MQEHRKFQHVFHIRLCKYEQPHGKESLVYRRRVCHYRIIDLHSANAPNDAHNATLTMQCVTSSRFFQNVQYWLVFLNFFEKLFHLTTWLKFPRIPRRKFHQIKNKISSFIKKKRIAFLLLSGDEKKSSREEFKGSVELHDWVRNELTYLFCLCFNGRSYFKGKEEKGKSGKKCVRKQLEKLRQKFCVEEKNISRFCSRVWMAWYFFLANKRIAKNERRK